MEFWSNGIEDILDFRIWILELGFGMLHIDLKIDRAIEERDKDVM